MGSRHSSMPLALPITNPSKPMAGGLGLCSKFQSELPSTFPLKVKHTTWNSSPLQTHSHCGTREAHRLDKIPSPNPSPHPQHGQRDTLSPSSLS